MLHELVHAYFMSLFDDFHNGNPSNPDAYNDFPYLFNFYVDKIYPGSTNSADIHHEEIANSYVNAIAAALKEYAIATGTPSTFPNLDQICSDLAWAGLIGTDIFNSKYPEGSPTWQRIKNRIAAEQSGHAITEGGIIQNQIGQPCN